MDPPAATPASAPGGNCSVNFADDAEEEAEEGEEGTPLFSTDETVAVPWTMPVKTATGAQTAERLPVRRCGRREERLRGRGRFEDEKVEVEDEGEVEVDVEVEANATAADKDADVVRRSCIICDLAEALLATPLLATPLL